MPTCSSALTQTRALSAQLDRVHHLTNTRVRAQQVEKRPSKVHKDNRDDIHETLKSDLRNASLVRGVQYNKCLTEEEIQNFQESFRGLMSRPNDSGVENKVLAHSFLQLNIYKSKADAVHLVTLLPGSDTGMVTADALLIASHDERIHQRNLLKRYVRALPFTPINLDDMSVSTGSLKSSWRVHTLPYPV